MDAPAQAKFAASIAQGPGKVQGVKFSTVELELKTRSKDSKVDYLNEAKESLAVKKGMKVEETDSEDDVPLVELEARMRRKRRKEEKEKILKEAAADDDFKENKVAAKNVPRQAGPVSQQPAGGLQVQMAYPQPYALPLQYPPLQHPYPVISPPSFHPQWPGSPFLAGSPNLQWIATAPSNPQWAGSSNQLNPYNLGLPPSPFLQQGAGGYPIQQGSGGRPLQLGGFDPYQQRVLGLSPHHIVQSTSYHQHGMLGLQQQGGPGLQQQGGPGLQQQGGPALQQQCGPGLQQQGSVLHQQGVPVLHQQGVPGLHQQAVPGLNQQAGPGLHQQAIPGLL